VLDQQPKILTISGIGPLETSNPFATPEPAINTAEIMKRIATIQQENFKQLDEDIDI
jgi:hypothetical protein